MKKVFKNVAIVLLMPVIVIIMIICMLFIFLQNIFISKKTMIENNNFAQETKDISG